MSIFIVETHFLRLTYHKTSPFPNKVTHLSNKVVPSLVENVNLKSINLKNSTL